jgi:hypothetical protein
LSLPTNLSPIVREKSTTSARRRTTSRASVAYPVRKPPLAAGVTGAAGGGSSRARPSRGFDVATISTMCPLMPPR